jgi:hypothetical protein
MKNPGASSGVWTTPSNQNGLILEGRTSGICYGIAFYEFVNLLVAKIRDLPDTSVSFIIFEILSALIFFVPIKSDFISSMNNVFFKYRSTTSYKKTTGLFSLLCLVGFHSCK